MLKYKGKDGIHGLVKDNRYHVLKYEGKDGKFWADVYLTNAKVKVGGIGVVPSWTRPFIVAVYSSEELFNQNWIE